MLLLQKHKNKKNSKEQFWGTPGNGEGAVIIAFNGPFFYFL